MNSNIAKLLTGAMIAGLAAGVTAFADDTQNAAQGDGQAMTQGKTDDGAATTTTPTTTKTVKKKSKKNGCNGKDGCGEKDGAKDKAAE